MKRISKFERTASIWLQVGLVTSVIAACTPDLERHGYIAKPGVFNELHEGQTKVEVESLLGSPTTTASINFNGDSYYYISQATRQTAFFKPVETDRLIIAVRFDKADKVNGVAQYGLKDGRIFDINSNKTAVVGSEFSLLKELFTGVGTAERHPTMMKN